MYLIEYKPVRIQLTYSLMVSGCYHSFKFMWKYVVICICLLKVQIHVKGFCWNAKSQTFFYEMYILHFIVMQVSRVAGQAGNIFSNQIFSHFSEIVPYHATRQDKEKNVEDFFLLLPKLGLSYRHFCKCSL